MKEVHIGDIVVYDSNSNLTPLVFVHAFPLTHKMWNAQVEFFSDYFRVITYDIRGFGKSIDSFYYLYTMEDFADDLLTIINYLALSNINICGLSMGGYVVQRAVIKAPSNFSTMILCDTQANRDDQLTLLSRTKFLNKIEEIGLAHFADDFMRRLLHPNSYQNQTLYNFIMEEITLQNIKGLKGASLAMATRIDTSEYLPLLNLPSLIVVGDSDSFTPLEKSLKLKNLLINSRLEIISFAGHLSPLENPIEFNQYLLEFLKKYNS
ncbi:MAG: alpha/beta fold hydrolase [Ignavibacteria bacterium]